MPPIHIYSQSPINAAKASGVTPKTDGPEESKTYKAPPVTTSAATLTGAVSAGPPPARPGAVPSQPRQTGAFQLNGYQSIQPTPTTNAAGAGPPPPQPGAVPLPPTGGRYPQQTPLSSAADAGVAPSNPYPPQMAIPTLTSAPYPPPRGTSTSAMPPATTGAWPSLPQPTGFFGGPPAVDERNLDHPPGYMQNSYAADMNSSQRAAAQASNMYDGGEDGEGVWDVAKKLAKAAGDRLSAVETEVWRRLNSEEK